MFRNYVEDNVTINATCHICRAKNCMKAKTALNGYNQIVGHVVECSTCSSQYYVGVRESLEDIVDRYKALVWLRLRGTDFYTLYDAKYSQLANIKIDQPQEAVGEIYEDKISQTFVIDMY